MQTSIECTLLDLLRCVNNITENEYEATAAAVQLINSGKVRLRGAFAGAKISLPGSLSAFPKSLWPALMGLTS